jgi:hypothetical protein
MTYSWAYIFHAPEADPSKDRFVIDRAGCKSTLVAVPDSAAAARVAVELMESGVKSIELCGYFGPIGAVEVLRAVEGKVAIGTVMFGSESIANVMKAFLRGDS